MFMKIGYIRSTSIGSITVVEEDEKIIRISFEKQKYDCECETPLIHRTFKQLNEYLQGNRTTFTIPISLKGTSFQLQVWKALQSVPYGETCSYQEIAQRIGNPKACRAVGMANHNNPIAIMIPCHRVIGKNGELTGYGGGLSKKQILLQLEQNHHNIH